MSEIFRIGNQMSYFEEPDTIVMRLVGQVTSEEGLAINEKHREYVQGRSSVFYLIDFSQLDTVPAPVRKAASQTIKEFPLHGLAFFQAPLKARVVAKLIVTAMKLFRGAGADTPIVFLDTEEEARAWIAKRREEVLAEVA
jgi:hypothetical protein